MSEAVVTPPVVETGAEPRPVDPLSVKLTVPVGLTLPPGLGAMVAVKVTGRPYVELPVESPMVVVVPSCATPSLSESELVL